MGEGKNKYPKTLNSTCEWSPIFEEHERVLSWAFAKFIRLWDEKVQRTFFECNPFIWKVCYTGFLEWDYPSAINYVLSFWVLLKVVQIYGKNWRTSAELSIPKNEFFKITLYELPEKRARTAHPSSPLIIASDYTLWYLATVSSPMLRQLVTIPRSIYIT